MPYQPSTAGAQGRAQRHFPLPVCRAAEQKPGHVGTGNQQNQHHCSQQGHQRSADETGIILLEPGQEYAEAFGSLGVLGVERHLDGKQLGLGGGDIHPRFETRDHGHGVAGIRLIVRVARLHERQDLGIGGLIFHPQTEPGGHHTDYRIRLRIESQDAADDVPRAAEPLLPELMADDHGGRAGEIGRRESSAELGRHAQGVEQIGGDGHAQEMIGFSGAGDREIVPEHGAHALERARGRFPVEVVAVEIEDGNFAGVLQIAAQRDYDLVGVFEMQRPEKPGIHDAEHGGIRADRQCQNQHRGGGKCRGPAKNPEGVVKIPDECAHDFRLDEAFGNRLQVGRAISAPPRLCGKLGFGFAGLGTGQRKLAKAMATGLALRTGCPAGVKRPVEGCAR